MAEEIIKVKVPDLPTATTLDGFFAFGVDGSNRSVKVPILMLQGNKDIDGKSLEFTWNGTKLGIRVAGTTTYTYVELRGADGADAYEVAVEEGFTGTREEWLQSLQGGQTDNWIKNW